VPLDRRGAWQSLAVQQQRRVALVADVRSPEKPCDERRVERDRKRIAGLRSHPVDQPLPPLSLLGGPVLDRRLEKRDDVRACERLQLDGVRPWSDPPVAGQLRELVGLASHDHGRPRRQRPKLVDCLSCEVVGDLVEAVEDGKDLVLLYQRKCRVTAVERALLELRELLREPETDPPVQRVDPRVPVGDRDDDRNRVSCIAPFSFEQLLCDQGDERCLTCARHADERCASGPDLRHPIDERAWPFAGHRAARRIGSFCGREHWAAHSPSHGQRFGC
jgi:hypothetical protein